MSAEFKLAIMLRCEFPTLILAHFKSDESDGSGIGSELSVFNKRGYSQFENLTRCFIKIVLY